MNSPLARLETYLQTYTVYPNCIQFRIQSSKVLEQWKVNQSFQLEQITSGKFFFKQDRKEILLLQYDLWSRFLYEIENFIIELLNHHGDEYNSLIKKEDIDKIIELSEKTFDVSNDVILNNENKNFDEHFSKIWLEAHESTCKLLVYQLKSLIGYSYSIFFTMIGTFLSKLMHYILITIHELNSLTQYFEKTMASEPPSLIVTPLDETCNKFFKKSLLCDRLSVYMKYFDLTDIYFKNYSDNKIDPKIFDFVEENNIVIHYKLNF